MIENIIIQQLNTSLDIANFCKEKFENFVKELIQNKIYVTLVDYTYYNADRLTFAKAEKSKEIENGSYEWAAKWRDEELLILKYLDFLKVLNIKKSQFQITDDNLYYFYLETEPNDVKIKEIIQTCMNNYKND